MNLDEEKKKEVVQNTSAIIEVKSSDINELGKKANQNLRKRIRLNLHPSTEDTLHEMLIFHAKDAYVRPHRHFNKSESFHVIQGELDVVVFNDDGSILKVIEMGTYDTGKSFCYRLAPNHWHTVIPRSEQVVFHEVTNGPFIREQTEFSSWSPEEGSPEVHAFQHGLDHKIFTFIKNK